MAAQQHKTTIWWAFPVFDVPTNHKDPPLLWPWNWYLCYLLCACVCVFAFCLKALIYQRGFLVCAGIGILYMTFMPIIGLFLACCRCCGNCGGKMYQKQTSSVHCRRRTLYWSLFITTIIILWVLQTHALRRPSPIGLMSLSLCSIGNIIMFQGNQALKENINQGLPSVTETVNNIRTFLNAVPQVWERAWSPPIDTGFPLICILQVRGTIE